MINNAINVEPLTTLQKNMYLIFCFLILTWCCVNVSSMYDSTKKPTLDKNIPPIQHNRKSLSLIPCSIAHDGKNTIKRPNNRTEIPVHRRTYMNAFMF